MEDLRRRRIEVEAIVVGYAMSRLDKQYLHIYGIKSWTTAYKHASDALGVPANSFKYLRDEFDPFHSNRRVGWHNRPLRPDRQRVLDELSDLSDDALNELVRRIFHRKDDSILEAIDSLTTKTRTAFNVAERLLTGRRAEEYFVEHSFAISKIKRTALLDKRDQAVGYDFGVANDPNLAIEVKGLKEATGSIQFTDKEWKEAINRRDSYWVIVVGNLSNKPAARMFKNPVAVFEIHCYFQRVVTATWRTRVSIEAKTR